MADLTPHRRGLARKCEARLRSSSYGGQPSRSLFSPAYAPWASARQPSLAARDYLSGLPSRSSRQLRPPSPFGLRRGSLHSLREIITVACRAEARGNFARLRPLGFGAAAFTRCASDDGLPSRSSRQPRPPSPFGLRRGSLHSLREITQWPAEPKLAATSPAFALFGLRRGSLHSLREIISVACRAEARGNFARLRPLGFGAQPSLAARAKAGGARLHFVAVHYHLQIIPPCLV